MLELYPNYYPKFTCTADQCPITCCQEWKISVDDDTYRNWFTIQPPTDVAPQKATLSAYTTYQAEARVIRLNEQKKMSVPERKRTLPAGSSIWGCHPVRDMYYISTGISYFFQPRRKDFNAKLSGSH